MVSSQSGSEQKLPGRATPQGTLRYAARFHGTAARGHFREIPSGLVMSSIGIGTYLGEPDEATDRGYTESVIAAVEGGFNVIDTAINYRFQRSERSIGAALKHLARKGYGRDDMVLRSISRANTSSRKFCVRRKSPRGATAWRRVSWKIS